jgi:ribosomal protein S18 acetylase RimI-like enzyme
MAAASDHPSPRLIELRLVNANDLEYLLNEEIRTWQSALSWDFTASAALVRRFVDMHALSGQALVLNGRVIGYSYFVCEERKGLIGDLYVLEHFANIENETRLLTSVLDALMRAPLVRRIESQLMMLRNGELMTRPHWRYLKAFRRNFMEVSLNPPALPIGKGAKSAIFDQWSESRQDDAAALIANAYQGHVDSEINDQYRSAAGARRFLMNIVQYPGCGSVFQPASLVSIDPDGARLNGICLSSLVASDVGHITQICVSKAVRGQGVGYELLRRSLATLAQYGCHKASLTVTASNTEAIRVYDQAGFHTTREFAADVWEGF